MLELVDSFHLGWNDFIIVQVQVLLPIHRKNKILNKNGLIIHGDNKILHNYASEPLVRYMLIDLARITISSI